MSNDFASNIGKTFAYSVTIGIQAGMIIICSNGLYEDTRDFAPCDGRDISREEYPFLFNAYQTDYGSGDGQTTFNIPKLECPHDGFYYAVYLGVSKSMAYEISTLLSGE